MRRINWIWLGAEIRRGWREIRRYWGRDLPPAEALARRLRKLARRA